MIFSIGQRRFTRGFRLPRHMKSASVVNNVKDLHLFHTEAGIKILMAIMLSEFLALKNSKKAATLRRRLKILRDVRLLMEFFLPLEMPNWVFIC